MRLSKNSKHYQGNEMKFYLIIATITAFGFTACTNSQNTVKIPNIKNQTYHKPTAAKSANFHNTMVKVAHSTQYDKKYSKMTLDTPEKKAWFKDLMYRLWDRQITRNQFISEGLVLYPTHRYEFSFVANGFQRYS